MYSVVTQHHWGFSNIALPSSDITEVLTENAVTCSTLYKVWLLILGLQRHSWIFNVGSTGKQAVEAAAVPGAWTMSSDDRIGLSVS